MNINIQKFQQLLEVSNTNMDELDKAIMLIQILTGKAEFEVSKMKVKTFNKLCAKINKAFNVYNSNLMNEKPKNIIRANGRWYWVNLDMSVLNAGRYIEVSTYLENIVGNLHKIMASICTPMKWSYRGLIKDEYNATKHEQYASDMLQADFSAAYHSALFFYAVISESMNNSLISLKSQDPILEVRLRNLLANYSDGFTQPKWLVNLNASS